MLENSFESEEISMGIQFLLRYFQMSFRLQFSSVIDSSHRLPASFLERFHHQFCLILIRFIKLSDFLSSQRCLNKQQKELTVSLTFILFKLRAQHLFQLTNYKKANYLIKFSNSETINHFKSKTEW